MPAYGGRTRVAVRFTVGTVGVLYATAGLGGCGQRDAYDEAAEFRALARIAVENRAARHRAHARAEPAFQALSGVFVRSEGPGSGCSVWSRNVYGSVDGVIAVACGDFRSDWPLTLEKGFLRCEIGSFDASDTKRVVFTTPGGRDYAVNEAARGVGYARIAPIFKPNAGPRYRSVLVGVGERLCD